MKGMAVEFCGIIGHRCVPLEGLQGGFLSGFFSRPNVLLLNDANLNCFRNRHSERRVTKRRISF